MKVQRCDGCGQFLRLGLVPIAEHAGKCKDRSRLTLEEYFDMVERNSRNYQVWIMGIRGAIKWNKAMREIVHSYGKNPPRFDKNGKPINILPWTEKTF